MLLSFGVCLFLPFGLIVLGYRKESEERMLARGFWSFVYATQKPQVQSI